MNFPAGLKYSDHDEWFRIEGDLVTIGITAYAQDALGELVHVELPEVGDTIAAGDAVCEVESVKAVAEVYCPADAEVVEINEELDGAEETVNSDPYGGGWMVRVRLAEAGSLDGLLDAAAYQAKIEAG